MSTQCNDATVTCMATAMVVAGLLSTLGKEMPYGRYWDKEGQPRVMLPARLAWFTQELPACAVPAISLVMHVGSTERDPGGAVSIALLAMFGAHYLQRTFIFSLLSKGRPTSLFVIAKAFLFCAFNGYMQSHNFLKCTRYPSDWFTSARFITGSVIFLSGMTMNMHSDHILRNLRKPGEYVYRIPRGLSFIMILSTSTLPTCATAGGLFELVSGANYLSEIVEWLGYALAAWTFPALAFAIFTVCCIGPRALHHHRFYLDKFSDYPKSRKALIPFLL